MNLNMNSLNSEELKKIQIMNNLAGMNPTGQLLFDNGIFKSQGNPALIVTNSTLQKKNLEKTANNSYNSNVNTPVKISETFQNKSLNYNNDLIRNTSKQIFFVYLLIIILLSILLFTNYGNRIKKIFKI
jgi:hypothetical protein